MQPQSVEPGMLVCYACSTSLPQGAKFCPSCGAAIGPRTCNGCRAEIPAHAKFCPECGVPQEGAARLRTLAPKHYAAIVLLAVIVCGIGWGFGSITPNSPLSEAKPTAQFDETKKADVALEPELKQLKDKADGAPTNVLAQASYAQALIAKINSDQTPQPQLVFEVIDVLARILKVDPKDKNALLSMADISFNQNAFSKASEYYARYLEVAPDDNDVRSNYASSLVFMGESDKAINELEAVLKKDPKSFRAAAYLAVVFAQTKNEAKLKPATERALKLAPSEEDKKRLLEFIENAKKGDSEGSPEAAPPSGSAPQADTGNGGSFEDFIKQNPVAGPKFEKMEQKGKETIVLSFKNFPMAQMPPFAKEKFFNSIKEKVRALGMNDIKTILFVDADTGKEMEKIAL